MQTQDTPTTYNVNQNDVPTEETVQQEHETTHQQDQDNDIINSNAFEESFFQPKKMSVDSTINDNGQIEIDAQNYEEETPTDIDNLSVKTFIDFRSDLQAYAISQIADGNFNQADNYKYKDWQKNKLIEAWTPIFQTYKVSFSPWINVIMSEAVCTAPLIGLALQNRKLRIENEKLKKELSKKNNEDNVQAPAEPDRPDIKTSWKVDEQGYFEFDKNKKYIKKDERKEKPKLTQENYALLCKHNGKENIDKIYNIQ